MCMEKAFAGGVYVCWGVNHQEWSEIELLYVLPRTVRHVEGERSTSGCIADALMSSVLCITVQTVGKRACGGYRVVCAVRYTRSLRTSRCVNRSTVISREQKTQLVSLHCTLSSLLFPHISWAFRDISSSWVEEVAARFSNEVIDVHCLELAVNHRDNDADQCYPTSWTENCKAFRTHPSPCFCLPSPKKKKKMKRKSDFAWRKH